MWRSHDTVYVKEKAYSKVLQPVMMTERLTEIICTVENNNEMTKLNSGLLPRWTGRLCVSLSSVERCHLLSLSPCGREWGGTFFFTTSSDLPSPGRSQITLYLFSCYLHIRLSLAPSG